MISSPRSSYTTFSYSDLVVSPSSVKAGDNVTLKVTVQNTGRMDGDEVSKMTVAVNHTSVNVWFVLYVLVNV